VTLSYKKTGVDVLAIKKSHNKIGSIISSTHNASPLARIAGRFGHYAGVVELPDGRLVATHTDGVGTKTMIAGMMKKYDTIGIDCIAMNVNDIICVGATPISFVDYIAANRNNTGILQKIAKGLAAGANKAAVPIVGGETAIMPDLFAGKEFAFDLAGTIVGIIENKNLILGNSITPGDIIVGAASTGIHSNGYTLARKALLDKYSLSDAVRGVGRIGQALLQPTEIYSGSVLSIIKECEVHGLAHITGGSFTKLLRLKNVGYEIDSLPRTPPIMQLVQDQGVSKIEMYRTFNMGVGFCVIAPPSEASRIKDIFKVYGIGAFEIGKIAPKPGVFVNSKKVA